MRTLILSTILSAIYSFSYGQEQWLVTVKMDTVYGRIYLETVDQYRADEARVKDEKTKVNYKSYQIRSVHLGENQDFETLKIDGRYQFAQVDIKGTYFSQYLYKDPEQVTSSNYVLKLLVNWKGEQFKFSNLTSKKKFAEYFQDCKSLSEKIESGKLKKKELEKIIAEFDKCMEENKNQSVVVQSVAPPVSTSAMEAFISDLKSKDLYNGEIVTMLEDINLKIANRQSIPNYMQQAVLSQLDGNEDLKAKFLALIKE